MPNSDLDSSNGSHNPEAQVDRILNRLKECLLISQRGNPKTRSESDFTRENVGSIRNQTESQSNKRRRDSIENSNANLDNANTSHINKMRLADADEGRGIYSPLLPHPEGSFGGETYYRGNKETNRQSAPYSYYDPNSTQPPYSYHSPVLYNASSFQS